MKYISYLKFPLLFIYIVLTNPLIFTRITDIGLQLGLAIFLILWALSIFILVALSTATFGMTKIIASLILVSASILSLGYYKVTNQYLEFFQFEVLFNAKENLPDVITTFPSITSAALISLSGLAGLLIPAIKFKHSIRLQALYILPITCLLGLIIAIVVSRNGEGTRALPSQFTPIAYWLILSAENIILGRGESEIELLVHPENPNHSDLILIMDESIRGDFLDINNLQGIPTNINNYNPINFGIASSFANCSAPSNQSMRSGVSRTTYLSDIYKKPSIWQYAKNANFNTVFIDTQQSQGTLGNNMTVKETKFIDDFLQVLDTDVTLYNKDKVAARIIKEYLNNDVKDFIYINKTGAHFPFEGKYPEDKKLYQPTMPPSSFNRSFADEDEVEYPNKNDQLTRLKFLNSYKNTLHWNINTFFSELFSHAIKQPFTIIYTADHGLTFHDDGREGYGTHCSINITDPEEGRVPLVFFTNSDAVRNKMNDALKINFNKVSHFNIPATTYQLMGYKKSDLKHYNEDIFSQLDTKDQNFLSRFYVRFGAKPIWNSIHKKTTHSSDSRLADINKQKKTAN